MKYFFKISFILSFVAVFGQAVTITRPDAVLEKLNSAESTIFNYQTLLQDQISDFRQQADSNAVNYYEETLAVIEENILRISNSDADIRASLAAQKQSICINNLISFVDVIISQSGFAISNCIEAQNITEATADILAAITSFESDVKMLAINIINALIGRNVFTDGDAIIARIQEILDKNTASDVEIIDQLNLLLAATLASWDEEIAALKACFEDIESSVLSAFAAVQAQIPVCAAFDKKGLRCF